METISLEPKQFSLNVGIEVAPLLQTMYKEPTMIVQSYGMNTQEGGQMCQVLAEHAQTLGTTHRGGVVVKFGADNAARRSATGTTGGTTCALPSRPQLATTRRA